MTENIIPDDQANGMVDGTLSAWEVPASLRGVSEVLTAAHQPATSEELAGMSAMVSSFTAAVVAPVVVTPEPVRSTSRMLTSRITTRAALMASVGLLVAGTAAAAAGGALPSPFHAARPHLASARVSPIDTTTSVATDGVTTSLAGNSTSTVHGVVPGVAGHDGTEHDGTVPEGSEPHGTEPDGTETDGPRGAAPAGVPTDGRHHGLCEAWTHGNRKQPNPAFGSLGTDAQHASKTVDQFCADVLARWNHDHGTLPSTSSTVTPSTVTPSSVTPTVPLDPQGPPSTMPHPHGPPITVPHQGPPTILPPIGGPVHGGPVHGGPVHGGPSTTASTTTIIPAV